MSRVEKVRFRGVVPSRGEASALLMEAGDVVLVKRDQNRLLVMRCPSGCGDILVLNLDRRAGRSWSLRDPGEKLSLYPSVWRTVGCESHFIVAAGNILWCDFDESWFSYGSSIPHQLIERAESQLRNVFRSFTDIAQALDESPWDVLIACRQLVSAGRAIEAAGEERGSFRAIAHGA